MKAFAHLLLLFVLLSHPAAFNRLNRDLGAAQSASLPAHAALSAPTVIHVPGDAATLQAALGAVPDGGIIELAAGTYTSPAPHGWTLSNINKGFTIRAAAGAAVTLDGAGTHEIIVFQNTSVGSAKPILFERLTFAHGYTTVEGLAGGLTLYEARATFSDCTFQANRANVNTTPGGAMFVASHAEVFFIRTLWQANISRMGGAGLGVRAQAKVYVHDSQFLNNNTNTSLYMSNGSAINLGDSLLRVTNTLFDGNRVGSYGAALYVVGTWTATNRNVPQADVIVANSLFRNNAAIRDASTTQTVPTEGGAINVEDQSKVRIYNSRFINNSAQIAGGVNNYRANVEIYNSVFLGNQATDTRGTSGFGGTITLNSADIPSDGNDNKPPASMILQDSWLQGRYGSVTTAAIAGACLSAGGDGNRIDPGSGIPNLGTIASNRASLTVRRTVFYDCDTRPSGDPAPKSAAGAIYVALTNFSMENSIVANSDATGTGSIGGGMVIIYHALANLTQNSFIHNSATLWGGAMFVQGAEVSLNGNQFAENVFPAQSLYGGVLFSAPDVGRGINASGNVDNNIFSNNGGIVDIYDDDRDLANTPYNDLHYNSNQFFKGALNAVVYRDGFSANLSPSGLNNLVITRPTRGVNTTKSPSKGNTSLGSAPVMGTILAVPPIVLSSGASGEGTPPTAYVGYTWSGGAATLDGGGVSGNAGFSVFGAAGAHTLSVNGSTFSAAISQGANPLATTAISAGVAPSYTLSWALQSGTFLDAAIDQGVGSSLPSIGSVLVSSQTEKTFYLYIVTQEGGYLAPFSLSQPVLHAPDAMTILVGLNPLANTGAISFTNGGGPLPMSWTASSQTPAVIRVDTPSGQTTGAGQVNFTVLSAAPGAYQGDVLIDAGSAGSQHVIINVLVLDHRYTILLPAAMR